MHAINMELHGLTGESPERADTILSHRYAFYNVYETLDGRFIALGALEPHFWVALCRHFGVSQYESHQVDEERRQEIIDYFRQVFLSGTLAHWESALRELPACWSAVKTFDEALESDLFRERDMVVDCMGPDGRVSKTFGVPIKMSHTPGRVRTSPVGFGESSRKVLEELAYDRNATVSFLDKGVV